MIKVFEVIPEMNIKMVISLIMYTEIYKRRRNNKCATHRVNEEIWKSMLGAM